MASELRVDKIVPTDGAPTNGGGGIVQVVSVTKTDHVDNSTNDQFNDISGVTATITPKFNTSKILVTVCLTPVSYTHLTLPTSDLV